MGQQKTSVAAPDTEPPNAQVPPLLYVPVKEKSAPFALIVVTDVVPDDLVVQMVAAAGRSARVASA